MQVIAINIAPDTNQYVCNFAFLYSPLSMLGAPGPILQPDIKSTRRPIEYYHGCAHYQREDVNWQFFTPFRISESCFYVASK